MYFVYFIAVFACLITSRTAINLDLACGNEQKILKKCFLDAVNLPEFQQVEANITKAKADAIKENPNWKECLSGSIYAPISLSKLPNNSYQAIVCEQTAASFNAELKLVCTKGTLNILFANFGRNNSQICAVPHSSSGSTSQICIDTGATAIVKNRCSNKTSCSFTQKDNYLFNDPCNETIKYLEVQFQCLGVNNTIGASAVFNPQTEKSEVCKDFTAAVESKLNTAAHKKVEALVANDLELCNNLSNAVRSCVSNLQSNSDKTHTYLGCFKSLMNSSNKVVMDSANRTNARDNCIAYCENQSYILAGLQGGKNCLCANSTANSNQVYETKEENCSIDCLGDSRHKCGGSAAISLYSIVKK